jgi:Tfp pilus assembly protein FimT
LFSANENHLGGFARWMRAHMTQKRFANEMNARRRDGGVSLLELMITLAIGMVLMAMAAPLVNTTISVYRLRGAGGNYANLLQQTRMRAVSNDRYYAVYASTNPGSVGAWAGMNAFADINLQGGAAGVYTTAQPSDLGVVFNHAAIVLQPQGAAPNVNNLYNQFMPGIALGAVDVNPNTPWAPANVSIVTFGPRGLPCYTVAAPPGGGAGTCLYTLNNLPVAFETFLQNQQTGAWEAITVNPSGRIREWRYNTSSATWQPLD